MSMLEARGVKAVMTYRLEVSNPLPCDETLLRTKETLLLEHKARADEQATCYGEDNADDLSPGESEAKRLGEKWNCLEIPRNCDSGFMR